MSTHEDNAARAMEYAVVRLREQEAEIAALRADKERLDCGRQLDCGLLMFSVLASIVRERKRQDSKWGADRNLPQHLWNTILMEEVGEVAEASFNESDTAHLVSELVQVAAVAVANIENIKRENIKRSQAARAGKDGAT